jgi:hypothetical protein
MNVHRNSVSMRVLAISKIETTELILYEKRNSFFKLFKTNVTTLHFSVVFIIVLEKE